MSTKPAGTLPVVRFATGIAEAGKHVDMAQNAAGIIKRRFIEFSPRVDQSSKNGLTLPGRIRAVRTGMPGVGNRHAAKSTAKLDPGSEVMKRIQQAGAGRRDAKFGWL
jgi:hypothetical protein